MGREGNIHVFIKIEEETMENELPYKESTPNVMYHIKQKSLHGKIFKKQERRD